MMIELGTGTVSILYSDGTSAAFDPEGLRVRLEKVFSDSGCADIWIAGEIVLAVEYALRCRTAESGSANYVIHAGDIDSCIARILEDTGYSAAAQHFKGSTVSSGDFGKIKPGQVEQYLMEKLQLTHAAAGDLALRIRQVMQTIGAAQCSPRLVLELARHFREEAALSHRLPTPEIQNADSPAPPVAVREKLWHVRRSDSIFPSIRAEINLPKLFENCRLTPPLTEFSLTPVLLPVAEQLDAECAKLRNRGAENYPLLLTLRGFSDFSVRWLSFEPETDKDMLQKTGQPFSDFLCSILREKPFKIFFR